MSALTIAYNPVTKLFQLPYTYTTKKGLVRSTNPRIRAWKGLAWQVIRARGRKFTSMSWSNPVTNPVFSLEGNFNDCSLYRFSETGGYLTVKQGTFIEVLLQLHIISRSGTEEHKDAAANVNDKINISINF